jgi:hypothetical protein
MRSHVHVTSLIHSFWRIFGEVFSFQVVRLTHEPKELSSATGLTVLDCRDSIFHGVFMRTSGKSGRDLGHSGFL